VSAAERDVLAAESPGTPVWVVSNVHHIPGSRRSFGERRDIFFIGAFAHPPNTDAVVWFGREIFPLIAAEEPSLRCFIIGDSPPAEVRSLASERLHVLGHVGDLGPYLDGCRVSVAPLRYGAGVKGKITQSLAHGIPVVATSVATEGMFLVDGESVLSAERPDDFARAVLRAYRDEALWEQLSSAGVAVMKAHFSFDAACAALGELADKGARKARHGMSARK
jgi:glycosyltransferase involved in cell wall biosynthesis